MTLHTATVAATDHALLHAVRATLASSDDSLLCVAFVHERGIRLIGDELKAAARRRAKLRLLVTTAFDRGGTTADALAAARALDVEVRVHNHAHGTYHPKLYLGARGPEASAVIGSANLTAGLACNVEVAAALRGRRDDEALTEAWRIGEALWTHERSEPWDGEVLTAEREDIETTLLAALREQLRVSPVAPTLGPGPRPNQLVDVGPREVLVETDASKRKGAPPQPVPAWMWNLAWDYLRTTGALTNRTLLNELRVHRSSAVCAFLARVPGVSVDPGRSITLRWNG